MPKKPSKKAARKTKSPAGTVTNKSQFIRDNAALSPKEIVAAAARQGIKLSSAMVYVVRSNAARKAAKKAAGVPVLKPGRPRMDAGQPKATKGAKLQPAGNLEAELRRIVLRIGLDRAQEVINAMVL